MYTNLYWQTAGDKWKRNSPYVRLLLSPQFNTVAKEVWNPEVLLRQECQENKDNKNTSVKHTVLNIEVLNIEFI